MIWQGVSIYELAFVAFMVACVVIGVVNVFRGFLDMSAGSRNDMTFVWMAYTAFAALFAYKVIIVASADDIFLGNISRLVGG